MLVSNRETAMRAQEIMTKDPACVTPGATVRDAAKLMQAEDTGVIPVVGDGGSRRLVGVLTDRDIALRVVGEGRDGDTRVSEVLSADRLTTCSPDDSVDEVMDAMARDQVRRIPVVDERGELLGIVSQADIVRKARDDNKAEETIEKISEPGRSR
jgi:CBS domain-containing protein